MSATNGLLSHVGGESFRIRCFHYFFEQNWLGQSFKAHPPFKKVSVLSTNADDVMKILLSQKVLNGDF